MVTCPMCGETKYDMGYDDGSVRVCYSCKNWGSPKDREISNLKDELAAVKAQLRRLMEDKK